MNMQGVKTTVIVYPLSRWSGWGGGGQGVRVGSGRLKIRGSSPANGSSRITG